MASRSVIEQAKGVLMATRTLDADAAFDLLRRASQHENRKLRDLAAEVVEAATNGRPAELRTG
jgi:AmiR/NasT family two-component response regulator